MRFSIRQFFLYFTLLATSSQADAKFVIDLTPTDDTSSGALTSASGGSFVAQSNAVQPTGTGYIDSFLRVQQTGQERGFNTSANFNKLLDDKKGNFTHAIQLKDIPTVEIGGVLYRAFLLDVNQYEATKQGDTSGFISLNQVQLFVSDGDVGASPSNYNLSDASGKTTPETNAIISFKNATQVFQLSNQDTSQSNAYEIQIDSNHGSGSGDMFFYVQSSLFGTDGNKYVTLFSQFGRPSGAYSSNAGFEEWAVEKQDLNGPFGNPVPAPAGLVLLLSGAPFALAGRLRRVKRAATA